MDEGVAAYPFENAVITLVDHLVLIVESAMLLVFRVPEELTRQLVRHRFTFVLFLLSHPVTGSVTFMRILHQGV